jgi:cell wall assembly regulator SMI1
MKVSQSWEQILRWTAEHAPCTHASFLPPVPRETLHTELGPLGRPIPAEIVTLYGLAGGQSPSVERAGAIFDGYWFMPLAGVDGLKQAWEQWLEAHEAGAEWATPNRFPFAKDFSGAYLCIEIAEDEDGESLSPIVAAGDCELEVIADSLDELLESVAANLEDGEETLDTPIVERHIVQFDACRARQVGDAAHHSVLGALGIRATIEDLDQLFGPFDQRPETLFGLAVRLVSNDLSSGDVEVELTDDRERPLRAVFGKGSGGAKPGVLVYAWSKRPLPAGARLRVTIAHRVNG